MVRSNRAAAARGTSPHQGQRRLTLLRNWFPKRRLYPERHSRPASTIGRVRRNLDLRLKRKLSAFRKIALGTWRTAYDPSVYGTLALRMDRAVQYIAQFREATGRRLTVSHLMAKAAASALEACPDANAILRLGRIYLRQRIGVFFQVVLTDEGPGKVDLSGATLFDVQEKSLIEICDEFERKVRKVRERDDPELEGARRTFDRLPPALVGPALQLTSFIGYTLNVDASKLGVPRDPFGSVMITNVGSLGLDTAYVPLVPYSRVPIILALSAVKDEPVAEDGRVVVGKVMRVNATFDHRIIDGFHASVMSKVLREQIEDPFASFGPIPTR